MKACSARSIASFDDPLPLDGGAELERFAIAYETYGTLDENRGNAVLICHALTAGAHAAGAADAEQRAGWWEVAIGAGKAFDTDKYFVVCSNVIGGCDGSTGPSSCDPATGRPYGLRFPVVTIGDMVEAQARLSHRLGIERYAAAAGGCMGGYQVLEWMARYPRRLAGAILISATPRTSAHTIGLWAVIREALMRDPDFKGGDYYDSAGPLLGQRLIAMFGMMSWMSRDVMAQRFGRKLVDGDEPRYGLEPEFEIEAFLRGVGDRAENRFDANSLIYLTRAMDYFDLSQGRGDLAKALGEVTAPALLLSYTSDWRYPTEEIDEIREALESNGAPVEHVTLDSVYGHGAFMHDAEGTGQAIREFLSKAAGE